MKVLFSSLVGNDFSNFNPKQIIGPEKHNNPNAADHFSRYRSLRVG